MKMVVVIRLYFYVRVQAESEYGFTTKDDIT